MVNCIIFVSDMVSIVNDTKLITKYDNKVGRRCEGYGMKICGKKQKSLYLITENMEVITKQVKIQQIE